MVFFLIIYIVYLLAFAVYSFFGLYHLWRYGYIGDLTKPVIAVYLVASVLTIVISFILIFTRQWPTNFSF